MARYGVQVIGRGRQCFVVANLPNEGGFRKGPMTEEQAMAMAEKMALELTALKAPKVVDEVKAELSSIKSDEEFEAHARAAGMVALALSLAAFVWFLVSR